jgi:5-formyltetrahydrofolate cyclo-ligase
MTAAADLKQSLRTEAIRHRARMSAEDPEHAVPVFFNAVKPDKNVIVAGYWPMHGEFDVRPIIDECFKRGHVCALPVMQKDSRVLKFARWKLEQKLIKGPFGVFEPSVNEHTEWLEPDIVITPLLAFDRRGYRLGHGYGYYDATIADLRAKKAIIAVGAGYAQQAVLFNLPVDTHDEKMDWIITPNGAQDFRS